jgi:hypothetical protein
MCCLLTFVVCSIYNSPSLTYGGNAVDSGSVGAASTGTLFSGDKFRTFQGELKLQEDIHTIQALRKPSGAGFPLLGKSCDQWAVVTTINKPTDSVKSVASLKGWCLVIVGDTKTADNYLELAGLANRPDIIFLSVTHQKEISNDFVKLIPFRSFARKNIGFLFAIRHGAKSIFDFDDDNVLLTQQHDDNAFMPPIGSRMLELDKSKSIMLRYLKPKDAATATPTPKTSHAFNPLPWMNPSTTGTWPRGFPLEDIKDLAPTTALPQVAFGSLRLSSVGVIQAVCNGDPDVDAVYRLTRPLPFTFDSSPKALKLLVPMDSYAPYNAQATTHMYDAFWGLLLPHTVPGRVTDIWRSYFTQRIMHDLNLALVYAPPLVTHTRTPHNYIADMQAEHALYMQTTALLQFLVSWTDQSTVLPARIEKLNIALYERGFIELDDVYGMQEWLLALLDVGYKFPTMEGSNSNTDLVVAQPVFRNEQPILGTPVYNVGPHDLTYPQFLTARHSEGSNADWAEWLAGSNKRALRPAGTVLKLILMVKDEWPLVKQWVLYHGELIGFDNLYILDGSREDRSISFLVYARDHLGVNVMVTPANLNELEKELTDVASVVRGASDFIIKMDPDEFLTLNTNSSDCRSGSFLTKDVDCTLSPYALQEYLSDANNLASIADGQRLRIGFNAASAPNRELCDAGKGDEVGLLRFDPVLAARKAIFDSRSFRGVDLGGHAGHYFPPHNENPDKLTLLSIIHVHYRCLEHEIANNRKAVTSHQYISEEWSDEMALAHLKEEYVGENVCNVTSHMQMKRSVSSLHKILHLAHALAKCPNMTPDGFYPPPEGTKVNMDFQQFLLNAVAKYS